MRYTEGFAHPGRDLLVSGQLRLYLEFPHGTPTYRNPAYGMVRSRYAGPGVDKRQTDVNILTLIAVQTNSLP